MHRKVYLAGPDVFFPNAKELGEKKKELCKTFGFIGLFPLDNVVDPHAANAHRLIYKGDVALMDEADFGIFNLTPFRGVSADPGTVFELGYMRGQKKPVFAYTDDYTSYLGRMKRSYDLIVENGGYYTSDGCFVENHSNIDNLMIDNAVNDTSFDIQTTFHACLVCVERYYNELSA